MSAIIMSAEHLANPVDVAELVLMERDWAFDRLDDGELLAEAGGMWGKYRVWFNWQEENGGLTLGCAYENKIPPAALSRVQALLSLVNAKLWLGHFEIDAEDSTVGFRHTHLMMSESGTTPHQLQTLLDIAVQESERFYPAFQSVVWGGKAPAEAMEMAMFETVGEA